MKRYFLQFISFILVLYGCDSTPRDMDPELEILAIVNAKVITKDDFIRRAEYTLRPAFCRNDNYIHKKIILNSLIAEKLFSLDVVQTDSIFENINFRQFLHGRETQAMRQYLYKIEGFDKAPTDTAKVLSLMNVAGRKYQISYAPVYVDSIPADSQERDIFFDEYLELAPKSLKKTRELSWDDPSSEDVFKALFLNPVKKNQILGPFSFDGNISIIAKIEGWRSHKLLGDKLYQKHFKSVDDKLKQLEGNKFYDVFVTGVMKGKSIELNPLAFQSLTEFLAPLYLQSSDNKKDLFNKNFWGNKSRDQDNTVNIPQFPDLDPETILLSYNGTPLSLGQFRHMLASHPLVFRDKRLNSKNFPQQLKYAIVDVLRDKELDKVAYEREYDKLRPIRQNVDMWRDSFLARYNRNNILTMHGLADSMEKKQKMLMDSVLTPHFKSLVKKYNDKIFINTELFESLEITSTDMLVLQNNVPYPVLVPGFPIYTDYNKLDYGCIYENE